MKTLVISNVVNNLINPSLYNLLGAANILSAPVDVITFGHNLQNIINEIAKLFDVNQVLSIDNTALSNLLVENIANQLAEICRNYTHILIASDSFGKNLLPRIAGILEIGQISDVISIVSPNVFKKFIYAGNVLVEIESLEDTKLISIRTNNFEANKSISDAICPITEIKYTNPISDKIKYISNNVVDKSVDLGSAKIVVSGGISLGSRESFDSLIRPLAQKLNAAVGATRAAVEAGYANNDTQVGQTGVNVAPELYLAVGLSGAVQHIAGMKDSKTVIAINTDGHAAIFEHADYGIVGDLFEIVPQLIEKL
jgi:electron transfer flavoprotein alpha subunit